MTTYKNITVYCGSHFGNDGAFASLAARLGEALGKGGFHMIYGGGTVGLMGLAADAAMAAGGVCDGPPGQRLPTFYGAYFRDPDGNKICVFKMG